MTHSNEVLGCPVCGYIEDSSLKSKVLRNKKHFTPYEYIILNAFVIYGVRDTNQLCEYLYKLDINEPESSLSIIRTLIFRINKKSNITNLNIKKISGQGGRGSMAPYASYTLISV